VVIGGSSGIGLETARRARTEAADVIIAGRNPDRLEKRPGYANRRGA
jgi:NAD(P)-dependent dehydrogenase (short-subunit alcohol dehydrogenase family)